MDRSPWASRIEVSRRDRPPYSTPYMSSLQNSFGAPPQSPVTAPSQIKQQMHHSQKTHPLFQRVTQRVSEHLRTSLTQLHDRPLGTRQRALTQRRGKLESKLPSPREQSSERGEPGPSVERRVNVHPRHAPLEEHFQHIGGPQQEIHEPREVPLAAYLRGSGGNGKKAATTRSRDRSTRASSSWSARSSQPCSKNNAFSG